MKTAAGFIVGFVAGFYFCALCIGHGIKDGTLDDVIDRVREKYPR